MKVEDFSFFFSLFSRYELWMNLNIKQSEIIIRERQIWGWLMRSESVLLDLCAHFAGKYLVC